MTATAEVMEPAQLPAPTDPWYRLIERCIESGKGGAELTGLYALAEKMAAARALEAFAVALNACQSEMPSVVKSKTNSHTESMYAALEDVVDVAKRVYTRHGFSVSFSQEKPWAEGKVHFVMTIRHRDGHVDVRHGEYAQDGAGPRGGANMNALQGTVSSGSYCQRDMLRLYFNIPIAGADQDGNGVADNVTINDGQREHIERRIEELGRLGYNVDLSRFCKWLGCSSLSSILQSKFRLAADDLDAKLAARRAKQPKQGGAK